MPCLDWNSRRARKFRPERASAVTFVIAQISDTHLSAAKPFFADNFRVVAEQINADRPDLVLNSGDISLNGAADEEDLAAARRSHDAVDVPVRYIPGNHDIGDNPELPNAHQPAIDEDRRARYRRYFGDDWWLLDVPGWRIIGVNAQLIDSALAAAAMQEEFIAASVVGTAGRAVALFIHKPLFDQHPDEDAVGGRFLPPAARQRLLARLAGRPPALVACGHVHQFRDSRHADARHVWAPSTAFVLPDSRQPRYGLKRTGYVEHRLHQDGTHDSRFLQPAGLPNLNIADFKDAYGEPPELQGAAMTANERA